MSRRTERLEEQIKTDLADMLQRGVTDPRLSSGALISITDVEVTADLRYARVYVSILGSDEEVRSTFSAIRHATGYFRHELAQLLTLRYVPELAFHLDTSVQRGARVLELLKQIEDESSATAAPATTEAGKRVKKQRKTSRPPQGEQVSAPRDSASHDGARNEGVASST
jgi:ribosome-binding factor A